MASINSQIFSMKELKCSNIVVFTDRAEVKRLIKSKLGPIGEHELVITDVTNFIDRDSIRVEGFSNVEVKSAPVVLDVVCQSKSITTSDENVSDEVKRLRKELKELEFKKKTIELGIERYNRLQELLNKFADCLVAPDLCIDVGKSSSKLLAQLNSSENVDNLMEFLNVHDKELSDYNNKISKLNIELENVTEKINTVQSNLDNLNVNRFHEAL